MRARRLSVFLFAFLGCALFAAESARAGTIRLRSGKALGYETLKIEQRAVRITIARDVGTVEVVLPFRRLDATSERADSAARLRPPPERVLFRDCLS